MRSDVNNVHQTFHAATLDETDNSLIKLLREDAHRSSEVLAKKLGISPATVRRRTRRLVKDNVMRIHALINPDKVGQPLAVIFTFDVDHGSLDSVMRYLSKQPEMKWVFSTTGRFDVMALARLGSTEELSKFVQDKLLNLEGVRNSETFVCLHEERSPFVTNI